MPGWFELGAKLQGIVFDDEERIAVLRYDLVTPEGVLLGHAGEVRIPYDALERVDHRLGGSAPLTREQQADLVAKVARPLLVYRFSRAADPAAAETLPPAPAETQDATVNAHGEVVDARSVTRVLPEGA